MKRLQEQDGAATFSQLPPDVLLNVFSMLSAKDLAAISMQDTYLRQVASDSLVWQQLTLARWPGADAERQYGGDWHRMYLARAQLPHAFPQAVDRVRSVTAAMQLHQKQQQPVRNVGIEGAGAPSSGSGSAVTVLPQLAFEDVMQQTFNAGLACSKNRAVRRSSEWRELKQDLSWWAAHRPEVVVRFVRETHEMLATGSSVALASATRSCADVNWRRSAIAFLQDLGLLNGAHASVVSRVAAEAEALDRAIRSVQQKAAGPLPAQEGILAAQCWFK